MRGMAMAGAQGEGLGGGEDLFVGEDVEGELVPACAHEYGAYLLPPTPIAQESGQESEAGEIEQTFDIS